MIQIDESFAGQEIKLPLGETLELLLPENRTAGFRWRQAGSLPAFLNLEGEGFRSPPAGSPPGTAGVHFWQLKGSGEGSAKLEFQSGRSWEEAGEPARKFEITVRVTG